MVEDPLVFQSMLGNFIDWNRLECGEHPTSHGTLSLSHSTGLMCRIRWTPRQPECQCQEQNHMMDVYEGDLSTNGFCFASPLPSGVFGRSPYLIHTHMRIPYELRTKHSAMDSSGWYRITIQHRDVEKHVVLLAFGSPGPTNPNQRLPTPEQTSREWHPQQMTDFCI